MQFIKEIPGANKPIGPYSLATKANGLIFLSGQTGVDPQTGKLAEGGIVAQAKQVMNNLITNLGGLGSSIDRVAMTTIFLTDMSDYKTVNEIYGQYIKSESAPARQTVAVKELPGGALIEISFIAVE